MARAVLSVGCMRTDERSEVCAGAVDALAIALLIVEDDGRIALANPRAAELLERSVGELEGADVASHLVGVGDLLGAIGLPRGTRRVTLPSGRTMDVGFTVTRISGPSERARITCAFQDITELTRLGEERDRLLKLATVTELMPSLLHELRNPLSAVSTALELQIEDAADERTREELHAIHRELRRAMLSLDGVGVVGREVRASSLAAIDHAVRESCAVLAHRAARCGVALETSAATLPLLYIDPGVARAVVFNLVTNAIHACRRGDRIHVSVALSGDDLVIEVDDTGTGMTAHVLAHCAELFFTTKRSGSGLGLPLCRHLAESANGSLVVSSTEGAGTRVTWRVPKVPAVRVKASRGGETWST